MDFMKKKISILLAFILLLGSLGSGDLFADTSKLINPGYGTISVNYEARPGIFVIQFISNDGSLYERTVSGMDDSSYSRGSYAYDTIKNKNSLNKTIKIADNAKMLSTYYDGYGGNFAYYLDNNANLYKIKSHAFSSEPTEIDFISDNINELNDEVTNRFKNVDGAETKRVFQSVKLSSDNTFELRADTFPGHLGYFINDKNDLFLAFSYDGTSGGFRTEYNKKRISLNDINTLLITGGGRFIMLKNDGTLWLSIPEHDWDYHFEKIADNVMINGATGQKSNLNAKASKQHLTINGKTANQLEVYNIDGHNYFKLRDIARLANNTKSTFSVSWNDKKKLISLKKGESYQAVGNELQAGNGKDKYGVKSTASVEINGKSVQLNAYTIENQNYFEIRPLAEALSFIVNWNDASKTIEVKM